MDLSHLTFPSLAIAMLLVVYEKRTKMILSFGLTFNPGIPYRVIIDGRQCPETRCFIIHMIAAFGDICVSGRSCTCF